MPQLRPSGGPAVADDSSELTLVKILAHNETHIGKVSLWARRTSQ
jgi:hypothetical protein